MIQKCTSVVQHGETSLWLNDHLTDHRQFALTFLSALVSDSEDIPEQVRCSGTSHWCTGPSLKFSVCLFSDQTAQFLVGLVHVSGPLSNPESFLGGTRF
jgi:hypothetical protein